MCNYFVQIILASRSNDDGWMNILFVVVLAVVWAVGGIIKAKANQAKQQNKIQPPRKPTARTAGASKDPGELILEKLLGISSPLSRSRQRPESQQKITKAYDAAPSAKRNLASKSQTLKSILIQKVKQMQESKFSLPSPSFEPGIEELPKMETQIQELPEYTSETVKKFKDGRVTTSSGSLRSKYLPELLSVYSNPDELRKAILHYEILGPPLSIRGSSGSFL